ncbi:hypothetical protein [Carboxylicivirga taeanensis]|uniref:hypothetical protein n=1 Tax=Carboxylicivirga taeanensis TaxID=1416875 RepID=UPI003F6DE172
MTKEVFEEYDFSKSAIYQIVVIGKMDKTWSSRLANMQISLETNMGTKNEYFLVGKLKDQAELIGVINTLYDLHLTLKSVAML